MKAFAAKSLFLLFGLLLLVWSIKAVDIQSVSSLLKEIGIGFLAIFIVYALVAWVDTIAWSLTFPENLAKQLNIPSLWSIRLIGESFNTLTPFGTLGGEPVKAQLLKKHHQLSLKQGLASQVIARTTFLFALIFFLIPGAVLIYQSEVIEDQFKQISFIGLITFATLILLFLAFQITGSLSIIVRRIEKFNFVSNDNSFLNQLKQLDSLLTDYYKNNRGRFVKSVFFALLGWWIGLFELYLTLAFLKHPLNLSDLWIIEALSQLVRTGSFFIPLGLGAQEGGMVLIFKAIALSGEIGLAVALVRRIREFFWVAIGLLLGWGSIFNRAPSSEAE